MTIRILGDQVIPQAIESISSTQLVPLGTVVRGVNIDTDLEADYIYAFTEGTFSANEAAFVDTTAFGAYEANGAAAGLKAVAVVASAVDQYAWFRLVASVTGLELVTTDATITVSASDAGQTFVFNKADGIVATLPAASGSGNKFRFVVKTTITSNNAIVKVANANDIFTGNAYVVSDDAAAVLGYKTGATDDTITLNGTTTGGLKGDSIEVEDIAPNLFAVKVLSAATGTEATPFSATV